MPTSKESIFAQHGGEQAKCWIMALCNFNFCRVLCVTALLDFRTFHKKPGTRYKIDEKIVQWQLYLTYFSSGYYLHVEH